MNTYKDFIKDTFDHYKCKHPFDLLKRIPVYDNENKICAFLRPITKDYKTTMPGCVSLLSKWRRENPTISTGTFEVADTRTEKWLENHVLGRDDRIIFMIVDLKGANIGHIGYASFDYENKKCEVDSVLRGVKGIYPGMMTFAMNSLLYWGISCLKLEHIRLKVFSDNTGAVKFYELCGFFFIRNIPLYKVILPEEEKWDIAPDNYTGTIDKYYTEMAIDVDNLKRKFNLDREL